MYRCLGVIGIRFSFAQQLKFSLYFFQNTDGRLDFQRKIPASNPDAADIFVPVWPVIKFSDRYRYCTGRPVPVPTGHRYRFQLWRACIQSPDPLHACLESSYLVIIGGIITLCEVRRWGMTSAASCRGLLLRCQSGTHQNAIIARN